MECNKEAVQPELKNNFARVALPCYVNEMTKESERFNPAKSADVSPNLDGASNVSSGVKILRTNQIQGIKTYAR